MKLLSSLILEREEFSLNDLTMVQRLALKKAYNGKVDFERMTDKQEEIFDSLVDLGLLDMGYDPTPDGERAVELMDQFAAKEREELAVAKELASSEKFEKDYDDEYDEDAEFEDDEFFSEAENKEYKRLGLNPKDIAKLFEDYKK